MIPLSRSPKKGASIMDVSETWEHLVQDGGVIVYVIIDGMGGLPDPKRGGTELEVAHTPNLDRLAGESSCGLLEPVGPGITPGSGPGHLALFGYDPLRYTPGRGIFSALGIDFDLKEGDVAARVSFATVDREGRVVDRRAGRIDTDTNRRLCKKIREAVTLDHGGLFFLETVSEHRAVIVLRGQNLGGRVRDTEPPITGTHPLEPEALDEDSKRTASIAQSFVDQARDILSDQQRANMVLLRGFDTYAPIPSLESRFGLRGVCIAEYPMYRGIGRLLGMRVAPPPAGVEASFKALSALYGYGYDFLYLHIKEADARAEDGDFEQKVRVIEGVDRMIPMVMDLNPDVLVVTADHSTPVCMRSHSWHPVPLMIYSRFARVDEVDTFDEYACMRGSLGIRPGLHLMGLALAHAGRLKKYGA
jgi:2,3-bisphosphoglycerate-independent phosphoglycerate mutase